MVYKIDNLDRKILHCLDLNSRQSASSIAKKCRANKNVVNFRINRLVERGIVKQFVAMISPSVLGLIPYKFYFQLQNFSGARKKEIFDFIKTLPLYWSAEVSGGWDFILGVMVKNLAELNDAKKKILNKFGNDIVKRSFSILVEAPHFYRGYLSDSANNSIKYWIKDSAAEKVDLLDIKILKILANNCRTPIIDISAKTGVTVKTVISRVKILEQKRIIYDYRISLNLEKIGLRFFKCLISLKDYSKKDFERFVDYCKKNENITHLVECVGDWDLEPEFEVESSEKFQEMISEIREKFGGMIKSIETINILSENSYTCLPS